MINYYKVLLFIYRLLTGILLLVTLGKLQTVSTTSMFLTTIHLTLHVSAKVHLPSNKKSCWHILRETGDIINFIDMMYKIRHSKYTVFGPIKSGPLEHCQ